MKRAMIILFLTFLVMLIVSGCSSGSTNGLEILSAETATSTPSESYPVYSSEAPSSELPNDHDHVFDEWITIIDPTENETGLMQRVCLICGFKETEIIPLSIHIHSFSNDWKYDDVQHWLICSCSAKDSVSNHVFDEWVILKKATESSAGEQERKCLTCGFRQIEIIPELSHTHSFSETWQNDKDQHWHGCLCGIKDSTANHTYGEWVITREATEISGGLREHSCVICGYTQSEVIPKLTHIHTYSNNWVYDNNQHWYSCSCGAKDSTANHTYGEWAIAKEATEKTNGLREHSCAICGYTQSEVIPKLTHKHAFSSNWVYDENQHWHSCSCEAKDSVANHTYGEWVIIKKATEESSGLREHSCAICGYTQSEVIPKLSHKHVFSSNWVYNENQHWHSCSCEAKDSVANHTYGEWFVIKDATEESIGLREHSCAICGYTQSEVIPKLTHTHLLQDNWEYDENQHWRICSCGEKGYIANHTYSEWVIKKDATEESGGLRERSCVICGYTQSEVIPKLTHKHTFSSDWIYDQNQHWHICTCGEKDSIANHTYNEWTIAKEATEESSGLREHFCAICGFTQSEVIPKLTHTHFFQDNWVYDENQHWRICSCGEKGYIVSHTYGEWVVVREATEEDYGHKERKCLVCQFTETAVIDKLPPAPLFNITYVLFGGQNSKSNPETIKSSSTIVLLPASKTGFEFLGWYTDTEFTHKITTLSNITSDVVLYASYKELVYSINYHLNGGTNSSENPLSVTYNDTLTLLSASRIGYMFNGWFKESGFSTQVKKIEHTLANIDLYAFFSPKTYSCTLNANGGYFEGESGSFYSSITISVTYDTDYKLPIPKREGFSFVKWIDSDGKDYSNGIWENDYNVSVVAVWEKVYSLGLDFSLSEDKSFYILSGVGDCKDSDIIIPSYFNNLPVKQIGPTAFSNCSDITSIQIPDSIDTIGQLAFYGCTGLTEFTIPADVTSIGKQIFMECSNLKTIYYNSVYCDSDNQFLDLSSIETIVFGGVCVPLYAGKNMGFQKHILKAVVTDNVKTIENLAFYECTNLMVVKIGSSVTKIGQYAFRSCTSLVDVSIPDSVITIGENAFAVCTSLKNLYLGKNIKTIGKMAFSNCESLIEVAIPSKVTKILGATFQSCTSLRKLDLHDNIDTIEDQAFLSCTSLVECSIPSGVKSIGKYAFSGCAFTEVVIPSGVSVIKNSSFCGCSSLKTLIIEDGITTIEYGAFSKCTSLVNVSIPNSVSTISTSAFSGCSALVSISLPNKLTSISYGLFERCTSLKRVVIPRNVSLIETYAFDECYSLEVIDYLGTKVEWSVITFKSNWNRNTGNYIIICIDGNLEE